ncbi:SpvB/TcaC N-terminal domain-containing protein [Burkholderia stabilis]|nr:SpvB/TcaC N-terminal domain-containing protein [Burkholderia stabilis]
MQQDTSISVQSLSLPKGGGAIVGLGDSMSPAGPTGMAGWSLPVSVSSGRGYAPALTLDYSSGAGNGAFGLGWQLSGVLTIRRRTSRGVPGYDGGPDDAFVGPDGEGLVSERDDSGQPLTTSVNTYNGKTLKATYAVTRYFPRVEQAFHRIEHWADTRSSDEFWLIHGADGQLHCLGKTPAARIADPSNASRVAEWRIEESVNPFGEHIFYRYVAENADGVIAENEAQRDHTAGRYLAEVYYGNVEPQADLYLWDSDDPSRQAWLFSLVLDYGERGIDHGTAPPYTATATWLVRADSFSGYQYGFEVRAHRLCRQFLMFHHMPEQLGEDHALVGRLLLTYQESPVVSQLVLAETLAYEADGDGTVEALPPLEFGYQAFAPSTQSDAYEVFRGVPKLNDAVHYQLVDLYGDGLPGVLFRHGADWQYRAPVRGQHGGDSVDYGAWQALPTVPAMQPARLALMDIDGDGRLDWLVTQPGLNGCFTLQEGNAWSGFTPFSALPVEFFHPKAQLADLVGAGLSDLALIGPQSVRLYANRRGGFAPGETVEQDADTVLPDAGRDARELVAFSDVLGSGQPHLVRIRHDSVTCWPNLGRGRFGQPFQLAPLDFDRATFDPDRLVLADLDGSGAADVLYIERDHIRLYLNQSGNGLTDYVRISLPTGLTFDRLCSVSFADLQGLGVASLVISHPHMAPHHWRLDFTSVKPYLLATVNNNMGASTTLSYRSSAQFWLDDKASDSRLTSSLPFAIHTLTQVVSCDEVTGNGVTSLRSYHQGVYDGREREFRGFGLVISQDAQQIAKTGQSNVPVAPPMMLKTWYHTGREYDEGQLFESPYVDAAEYPVGSTTLTSFDAKAGRDCPLDQPSDVTRWWLYRALKGLPLRQEVYGLDGSDVANTPYSVSLSRYQSRQVQAAQPDAAPVALPTPLEQIDYRYERIAVDPLISQAVQLQRDAFGSIQWSVAIAYPRRARPKDNPYPATLPSTSWASSYDTQQQELHLTETRHAVIHLSDHPQAWRLNLPFQQRTNVLVFSAGEVPGDGLNFEALMQVDGLLAVCRTRVYGGQQQVIYTDTPVTLTALVDHVESAEFDDDSLAAYDDVLDQNALNALLEQAGYQQASRVLPTDPAATDPESAVWVAARDYSTYLSSSEFYRPSQQQSSRLVGVVKYAYDDCHCVLTQSTDALGNETTATYNYRFLQPCRLVDPNGNTQEAQFNALGRVVATSIYGSEAGDRVGFSPVSTFSGQGWTVASAISQAGSEAQRVATIEVIDVFSWMGQLTLDALKEVTVDPAAVWSALVANRLITVQGHVLAAGRRWATQGSAIPGIPDTVRPLITALTRLPVQHVTLVADRYPDDEAQQVRINLAYFDGDGRTLQSVQKVPGGLAWQRKDDGEIVVDDAGNPISVDTTNRWAVSGKIEFDNKGQPVRSYQPYFVNDWRYVADKALRTCGYADTHCHDATGREIQVTTAKGTIRRNGYYPWFTVVEDENDTWGNHRPDLGLYSSGRFMRTAPFSDQPPMPSSANLSFGTPTLDVRNNRGEPVRTLAYNRASTDAALDERIERTTYDSLGRMASGVDARLFSAGGTPNFRYAASLSGHVLRTAGVDAGTTVALADVDGRPVWSRDARGTVSTFAYDALGRPLSVTETAGDTTAVRDAWVYGEAEPDPALHNLRGQCVRRYDPAGRLAWPGFSLTGQPLTETRTLLTSPDTDPDWAGGEAGWASALETDAYPTAWAYDATGAWHTQTDAKGNMQVQTVDIGGRLASRTLTLTGGATQPVLVAIDYSAAGQVQSETAGNGVISTYGYEPQTQRLVRLTVTRPDQPGRRAVLRDLHYDYDPVGNVLGVRDAAQSTTYWRNQRVEPVHTYTYDALYQLLTATGREMAHHGRQGTTLPPATIPLPNDDTIYTGYTRRYTYDRGGNLTQIRHQGTAAYTQDIVVSATRNHALAQNAEGSLTPADVDDGRWFDAAGNQQCLLPDRAQPLAWNDRNRLMGVTLIQRASGADDRETYQYGADAMRVRKRTTTQTSGTTRIAEAIYLPGLTLRVTRRDDGTTVQVVEALHEVQASAGRTHARALHWESGMPPMLANDALRFGHADLIGSLALELDGQADLVSREEYYPYGGTAVWSARSQVEADTKFIRYSGQERDVTGLYDYGWRSYQPWLGRWLNPDPAGTIDGFNLFGMVGNNPLTYMDMEGTVRYLYVPFMDMESIEMAHGHNMQRDLVNKSPDILVFPTERELNKFQGKVAEIMRDPALLSKKAELGKEHMAKYDDVPTPKTVRELLPSSKNSMHEDLRLVATGIQMYKSIFNLPLAVSEERNKVFQNMQFGDKLYIASHGAAGYPGLANNQGLEVSMRHLARRLQKANLPDTNIRIVLTSCESAHSGTDESTSGVTSLAPAQTLINEFKSLGYKNLKVAGYRGSRLTFGFLEESGHHNLQTYDIISEDAHMRATTIRMRSSTVRKIFD